MIRIKTHEWTSICVEDGCMASDLVMSVLYIKGLIDFPVEGDNKWRLEPRPNVKP